MTSIEKGNWVGLGLVAVLVPQITMAATTSVLVTRAASESPTLATVTAPTLEVPTTVIQEHDDLSSIIEAEAALDITADEAPTDVEIITQIE